MLKPETFSEVIHLTSQQLQLRCFEIENLFQLYSASARPWAGNYHQNCSTHWENPTASVTEDSKQCQVFLNFRRTWRIPTKGLSAPASAGDNWAIHRGDNLYKYSQFILYLNPVSISFKASLKLTSMHEKGKWAFKTQDFLYLVIFFKYLIILLIFSQLNPIHLEEILFRI